MRYTVEADGPLIASLRLYPGGRSGVGDYREVFTNRAGIFRNGQTDSVALPGGPAFTYSYEAVNALQGVGIDPRTRFYYFNRAPVGATTASPMTTLIYDVGDEALTLRAMQLNGSTLEALPSTIAPLTYSASQEIAGVDRPVRGASFVIAANVRIIALLQVAYAMRSNRSSFLPGLQQTTPIFETQSRVLADFIRNNPDARLFTQEGTEAYLRATGGAALRPEVIAAAARLVNWFGLSTRSIIAEPFLSSSYMLAIQGYLFPQLRQLVEANSIAAAGRTDAITPDEFFLGVAQFRDLQPEPQALYFAGPDFIRLRAGDTTVLRPLNHGQFDEPTYGQNDLILDRFQISGIPDDHARSVSVPARFATALAAELLPDGSIRVTALPGFVGTGYVEYRIQAEGYGEETGRIWVTVEPPA